MTGTLVSLAGPAVELLAILLVVYLWLSRGQSHAENIETSTPSTTLRQRIAAERKG